MASGLLQKYYQETNEQSVDTLVQENLNGRTNEIGDDMEKYRCRGKCYQLPTYQATLQR